MEIGITDFIASHFYTVYVLVYKDIYIINITAAWAIDREFISIWGFPMLPLWVAWGRLAVPLGALWVLWGSLCRVNVAEPPCMHTKYNLPACAHFGNMRLA